MLSHSPLIAFERLDTFFFSTFTRAIILVFLSNQHGKCKHSHTRSGAANGKGSHVTGRHVFALGSGSLTAAWITLLTPSTMHRDRRTSSQSRARSASHALHICSVPGISSNHGLALFELCLVVQIAYDCCISQEHIVTCLLCEFDFTLHHIMKSHISQVKWSDGFEAGSAWFSRELVQ